MAALPTFLWVVASVGALAPVPRGGAAAARRAPPRFAAPAVVDDVAKCGHILGFGDPSHEPTKLQRIMARCVAAADAVGAGAIPALKARARALDAELGPPLDAAARLRADAAGAAVAIAAEFKRASPSKGPINVDADVRAVARAYADAGASRVSVLTEPESFRGGLGDLLEARRAVNDLGARRPALLRKDFVGRPVQVWEARAHGADAARTGVDGRKSRATRSIVRLRRSPDAASVPKRPRLGPAHRRVPVQVGAPRPRRRMRGGRRAGARRGAHGGRDGARARDAGRALRRHQ